MAAYGVRAIRSTTGRSGVAGSHNLVAPHRRPPWSFGAATRILPLAARAESESSLRRGHISLDKCQEFNPDGPQDILVMLYRAWREFNAADGRHDTPLDRAHRPRGECRGALDRFLVQRDR
ncbi:hypothetical protein Zmor_002726 [Zophobas morio]|uniref:Uncharacterized protein n=1 Tax=Zophobas morio TaxID=2755281 RepID=A0AA38HLK9_9CUCU|nr:hypothetical protein Zmor_002726 [Zophobas morio]